LLELFFPCFDKRRKSGRFKILSALAKKKRKRSYPSVFTRFNVFFCRPVLGLNEIETTKSLSAKLIRRSAFESLVGKSFFHYENKLCFRPPDVFSLLPYDD